MTADLKKFSYSLRRDTPEEYVRRALTARRAEIVAKLRAGESFEMRDLVGRRIRIAPSRLVKARA